MKVTLPGGKNLALSVVPLDKLKPHEDVIPSLLSSVKRDILRTGFQRDPIVIDHRTKIVLDGMHRLAALRELGSNFALCVEFNYFSKSVILERWLRYFIAPDRKMIQDLVSMLGLRRCPNLETAIKAVDESSSRISLLSNRESFTSQERRDPIVSYRILSRFDDFARSKKMEVQFHPEDERSALFRSDSVFVLYPPKLEKKEIIFLALRGKVLPFKTTRHVVPLRPMGVYFPLKLLMQTNFEVCNRALKKTVAGSKIELHEKSSWYEGRRYSEPLAIFRSG